MTHIDVVASRMEINSCEDVEEPNMHAKKLYELLKDAVEKSRVIKNDFSAYFIIIS